MANTTPKSSTKAAFKSVTIIGLIILVLNHFLPDLPIADVEQVLDPIAKAVGAIMVFYGRWRKGDLKLIG